MCSMVVLDQLPMVCTNLEGGCLLPDEFLIHPPPSVTPALVKSKIHPASYMLWDKLYEHLVKIVKYNIMLSHEVRTRMRFQTVRTYYVTIYVHVLVSKSHFRVKVIEHIVACQTHHVSMFCILILLGLHVFGWGWSWSVCWGDGFCWRPRSLACDNIFTRAMLRKIKDIW